MSLTRNAWLGIAGLLLAGVGLCYLLFRPPPPIVEHAAAEVRQPDNSLVVARAETAPKTKPKAALPKGGKLERQVRVTVQPSRRIAAADVGQLAGKVTVDLSLVRMSDQTRRVVASSPDGAVVGGIDIPVETPPVLADPHPWAAGVSYAPQGRALGGWVERRIADRIVLGVDVNQVKTPSASGFEARVRVGVTW